MGTCHHQVLTTFLNLTGFNFSFTLIDFLFLNLRHCPHLLFKPSDAPLNKGRYEASLIICTIKSPWNSSIQEPRIFVINFRQQGKDNQKLQKQTQKQQSTIVKTFSRQRTKSIKEAFTLCRCRVNDFSRQMYCQFAIFFFTKFQGLLLKLVSSNN